MFTCLNKKNWHDLDHASAISWINKRIGRQGYEVLWSSLFEYKFFTHQENVSAAWIWARIRRVGLSRQNFIRENLGSLDGGSALLLERLATEIRRLGGRIHFNAGVKKFLSTKTRSRESLRLTGKNLGKS